MGSDSDWPVMQAAAEALAEFDVPYEVGVYSAHRTPQRMLDYATAAAGRGLKVIIAGAGRRGAPARHGRRATPLPVIGVPVPLARLDGLDSLLSIVQMPAGVPGGDRGGRRRAQRRPARRPDPRRTDAPVCAPDGRVPGRTRTIRAGQGRGPQIACGAAARGAVVGWRYTGEEVVQQLLIVRRRLVGVQARLPEHLLVPHHGRPRGGRAASPTACRSTCSPGCRSSSTIRSSGHSRKSVRCPVERRRQGGQSRPLRGDVRPALGLRGGGERADQRGVTPGARG